MKRVNSNCGKFTSLHLMFLRCMVIAGLYFSSIASPHAQTERLEREVAGRGADNMAAILNALQEATFQVCGVRIQTSLDMESAQTEIGNSLEMSDRINRSIRASTVEPSCEFEGYGRIGSHRRRETFPRFATRTIHCIQGAGTGHKTPAHRSSWVPYGGRTL